MSASIRQPLWYRHMDVKRPTRRRGAPKARVRHTSTRRRLFAQVDFRREMRPIEFVDPGAFTVTNPTDGPTTYGLPVIECLLEAADRVLYQMKGGGEPDSARQVQRRGGRRCGTLCFDHRRSLFSVAARRSMVCPTASRPMRVTAP